MVDIWTLSGVDVGRWHLRKGSSWRPLVQVRTKSLEIPDVHGTTAIGLPVFETPQVSFRLRTDIGAQDTVEAMTNELIGLLAAPGLTLGRDSGGIVTSAVPRLLSISDEEFIWNHSARFVALLDIPGVFLRAASLDTTPTVVVSGQTYTLSGLGVGTAPVTDAVLRFLGPLTSVSAIDPVSGTGVSWTGTLAAATYLYLHPNTMTARTSASSSAWASGGTDVSGTMSRQPSGTLQIWPRMVALDPSVRSSRLTVTGTGFTGATALSVRAQPAYL
jgi:hypothetical protein